MKRNKGSGRGGGEVGGEKPPTDDHVRDRLGQMLASAEEVPPPAAEPENKKRGRGRNGDDADGGDFILDQFKVTPSGLWHFPIDKHGEKGRLRVCSKIEAVARTRDERGENHGVLLKWPDKDNRVHEWAMPSAMLAGDGAGVREYLLNRGAVLAPSRAAREALMMYLNAVAPEDAALSVSKIGWHQSAAGLNFVLPEAVYGPRGGERVILQQINQVPHNFAAAGTLAEWQRDVARLCLGNSRLMLAVSMAFASPLLHLVGEESGGVNLLGQSRSGKSTAIYAAASVWGRGSRSGYIRQWRSTSNGLESVCEAQNDTLLCLDELGQLEPREAGNVAYMIANESGKNRAARDGSARAIATWRLLFLSSGEVSIGELSQEAGQRAKAGQEVRIVDVPADTGSGLGIFEDLQDGMTEALGDEPTAAGSRSAAAAAFSVRLREAAGRCYGTAAPAFLTALANECGRNLDGVLTYIREHVAAFVEATVPPEAGGQVRSVAGRFALISAAGELATRYGVTGWPAGTARQGASLCFRAWQNSRGTVGAREDEMAIEAVRNFIELHGAARFADWKAGGQESLYGDEASDDAPHEQKVINRAGWKRWNPETGVRDYYIGSSCWGSEVLKGVPKRNAARALLERGHLVPDKDGSLSKTVHIPGFRTVRVYHIKGSILGDGAGAAES
jgi:uncharacterized protein (DUF927 family)